ncbi:MAG: AAA family ATPase [Deltaproteobacteria bacterium]|nr:AAA family ATPase [Deltaproteobacteria bacterium]
MPRNRPLTLPAHITALLDPEAYPERPASIELRQTHISYIFFTPDAVYKIKKPVNFGFLDFSTPAKRLFYCNEEVRLNKRLAPDMYYGVVPVCEEGGRVRVGGPGTPVDYAVKMTRLRPETILEEMVKKDEAAPEIIKKVAQVIAGFHKAAATDARISAFGSADAIRKNCEENFSQTGGGGAAAMSMSISRERLGAIRGYAVGFLKSNEALFQRRVKDGFIRDCHGDIHLENISIDGGVRIFDCIEFSERFRFSDTASDIAFLSMDLDFHNRHDLARLLEDEYLSAMNDSDGGKLLNFYKCYRAYVRGKVDGLKFMEAEVTDAEKSEAFLSALRHFHLSAVYASGGFIPMMIILGGLSGTGKTALAMRLAKTINAPAVSSDTVRKELAGVSPHERLSAGFQKGIYSAEFTEKTYNELVLRGAGLLRQGRTCILDATFSKNSFIEKARAAALSAKGGFKIIECRAGDETIKDRITKRLAMPPAPGEPVSDITWEVYQEQKRSFEAIGGPILSCNAEKTLDENSLLAIKWLFS